MAGGTVELQNSSTFVFMLVLLEELIHMYVHHVQIDNVIEAHCYALQCGRIDCEQIRSRINQQLIAGRFGHEGLCQLCTKLG